MFYSLLTRSKPYRSAENSNASTLDGINYKKSSIKGPAGIFETCKSVFTHARVVSITLAALLAHKTVSFMRFICRQNRKATFTSN